eukprot:Hpha_TRINITY_DN12523_c0_g1::TRINITY_DN12523_c0_g1_i2::g.51195::m.51195
MPNPAHLGLRACCTEQNLRVFARVAHHGRHPARRAHNAPPRQESRGWSIPLLLTRHADRRVQLIELRVTLSAPDHSARTGDQTVGSTRLKVRLPVQTRSVNVGGGIAFGGENKTVSRNYPPAVHADNFTSADAPHCCLFHPTIQLWSLSALSRTTLLTVIVPVPLIWQTPLLCERFRNRPALCDRPLRDAHHLLESARLYSHGFHHDAMVTVGDGLWRAILLRGDVSQTRPPHDAAREQTFVLFHVHPGRIDRAHSVHPELDNGTAGTHHTCPRQSCTAGGDQDVSRHNGTNLLQDRAAQVGDGGAKPVSREALEYHTQPLVTETTGG